MRSIRKLGLRLNYPIERARCELSRMVRAGTAEFHAFYREFPKKPFCPLKMQRAYKFFFLPRSIPGSGCFQRLDRFCVGPLRMRFN